MKLNELSRTEQFLHKLINNRAGKWRSMALSNIAAEMPLSDLLTLARRAQAALVVQAEERVAKFAAMDAPPIIMQNESKKLTEAQDGTHADLKIIQRHIRKQTG